MNFADVTAGLTDLRHAISTQIQKNAFKEIGTRGPSGAKDEAGFLRLVAWSYSCLYERGRIIIPYLLGLPGRENSDVELHMATRKAVQTLRTWLFHSLDSDSDRDFEIGRSASAWFLAHCLTTSPQNTEDWERACSALCLQVTNLIRHCTGLISDVAQDPEKAQLQFGILRLRMVRDWQAFEYDQFVEDAATRLGERIEAKGFRERRLSQWRKFLATLPDEADLKLEMQRVIDGEVFQHFRSRLPVTSEDLMETFGLEPGMDVLFALEMARHLSSTGMTRRDLVLNQVSVVLLNKVGKDAVLAADKGSGTGSIAFTSIRSEPAQ